MSISISGYRVQCETEQAHRFTGELGCVIYRVSRNYYITCLVLGNPDHSIDSAQ